MEFKKETILFKINPATKIVMMVLVSLLVTFSYDVFIPISILAFLFLAILLTGDFGALFLSRKMIPYLVVGFSLSLFLILPNSFNPNGDIQFLVFNIDKAVLIRCIAIGLRLLTFALMSLAFVLSTEPRDFVMSLIQQFRMPYVIGYSFLSAYRFLPTFGEELNKIILAQEIRGEHLNKNIFSRIYNAPKYLIPLLAVSIRKAERIALAMESRGFKMQGNRNYYRKLKIGRIDIIAMGIISIFMIGVTWFAIINHLADFQLGL